ncbi:hypothetical protein CYMTET_21922 [Cymbomonas tetramitiformis]|uniref:Uncharacterized protein n=1 Tax=Cymbomonas tetramitiformis TaxID=36881 RepID=A0AAE0G0W5_9CHLO|nr:hypothetical protein CYMTET_21922 [Cymbomonas tetramitiformis]
MDIHKSVDLQLLTATGGAARHARRQARRQAKRDAQCSETQALPVPIPICGTVPGIAGNEAPTGNAEKGSAVPRVGAEHAGGLDPVPVESASPLEEQLTELLASTGPAAREARRKLKRKAKKKTESAPIARDIVQAVRNQVTVRGADSISPITSFSDAPFPAPLIHALKLAGYKEPSPIQAHSWPIAVSGQDLIAVAETGSGKTLCYLLPALAHIMAREKSDGRNAPRCLVLAPTRELVLQIQEVAVKYSSTVGVRAVAIYGGAPRGLQIQEVQDDPGLLISTPGRLLDFLCLHDSMKEEGGQAVLTLAAVRVLVLDEADRMLDMGFEPDIRKVVDVLPPKRQAMFFTATWPQEVEKVAAGLLTEPVEVHIGAGGAGGGQMLANADVTQVVLVVQQVEKGGALRAALAEAGGDELQGGSADNRVLQYQVGRNAAWGRAVG